MFVAICNTPELHHILFLTLTRSHKPRLHTSLDLLLLLTLPSTLRVFLDPVKVVLVVLWGFTETQILLFFNLLLFAAQDFPLMVNQIQKRVRIWLVLGRIIFVALELFQLGQVMLLTSLDVSGVPEMVLGHVWRWKGLPTWLLKVHVLKVRWHFWMLVHFLLLSQVFVWLSLTANQGGLMWSVKLIVPMELLIICVLVRRYSLHVLMHWLSVMRMMVKLSNWLRRWVVNALFY